VTTSDVLASLSVGISVIALGIAIYTVQRANKTTSAATMVTLNEGFRSAWERYLRSEDLEKAAALAELLNLFEVACAAWAERSITGNSAELLQEYLQSVLRLLAGNKAISEEVSKELIQDRTTFKFIRLFLQRNRTLPRVYIPLSWYQAD
jgi:hypothetical protein